MRIAYFDCFSGISGDMTIAAFLDAGLKFDTLSRELAKLKIKGYELKKSKVKRGVIAGTKFDCVVDNKGAHSHRPLKEIFRIIEESPLKAGVKKMSKGIFTNIGSAEARIHGTAKTRDVHLHELGDIDSIVDIVGTAIAIDAMKIDALYASEINMGRTFVDTRHGRLPIPAPAALELLKGVPMKISEIEAELVTPTGAGILRTLSKGFGRMPRMEISEIGYGAGTTIIKEIPNMLRIMIGRLCLSLLAAIFFIGNTDADVIRTKDGKGIKGIIVEDYKDRVVISTADGEVTLMKANLRDMAFDSEEDNLIKLGDLAKEKREFDKAYSYYHMALDLNPDSKAAKDGIVFIQGYLFRAEEVKKEDDIEKQERLDRYGTTVETPESKSDKTKESVEKLKNSLGLTLEMRGALPEVGSVRKGSPAYDSGLRKGDLLIAVWGRLTGYMPLDDVMDILLEKPSLEIKTAIERTVDIGISRDKLAFAGTNDLIGATFGMELDGLTIASYAEGGPAFDAGIEKGDLVIAIDGKSTRYMPFKEAINMIKNTKEESVKLTIRREVIIWRRDRT